MVSIGWLISAYIFGYILSGVILYLDAYRPMKREIDKLRLEIETLKMETTTNGNI